MSFQAPSFSMINVNHKAITRRHAIAQGTISMDDLAYEKLVSRTLPKGDALSLAQVAGVMAAKSVGNTIPMCHPLNLDCVDVEYETNDDARSVTVYCSVIANAKTGVEMEALGGVNGALLVLWDLLKGTFAALDISGVRLNVKRGGKSGIWLNPELTEDEANYWKAQVLLPEEIDSFSGLKVACVTMSDRASAGEYEDLSGKVLFEELLQRGAEVIARKIVPDEVGEIESCIKSLLLESPDIIVTTGGTGIGPRDVTVECLQSLCATDIPGIGELLRSSGMNFISSACLSRSFAGVVNGCILVALPGSVSAVKQAIDELQSVLPHAVQMLRGNSH